MNKRFFLDISGIFAAVLCVIITIFFGRGSKGEYIFYMFSFLISGSLICFSLKDFPFRKEKIQDKFLSELVLLREEDIDIDLSDTYFSGTVSDIHAILNYVDGFWYIEDMQSKNGTQIKGCLENKLYNIKDGQSKLTKKDYIFIGLNKLQIR